MMRRIISLILVGICLMASAQDERESKAFKDRFFLGMVSAYYIDFVSSPLQKLDRSVDLGGGVITPDTAVPFQTTYLSYVSIGLEPRYNLYEFNEDLAIAVSMPMTVGFGQAFPQNEDVEGASGFGNVQVPLMLKGYYGTQSTYDSRANFGLSAGIGLEYNKLGLVDLDGRNWIKDANKGWFMPCASIAFHMWRNNAPIEVNLKIGRGPMTDYDQDKFGQFLTDGKRKTRASSAKLSFVYLFN